MQAQLEKILILGHFSFTKTCLSLHCSPWDGVLAEEHLIVPGRSDNRAFSPRAGLQPGVRGGRPPSSWGARYGGKAVGPLLYPAQPLHTPRTVSAHCCTSGRSLWSVGPVPGSLHPVGEGRLCASLLGKLPSTYSQKDLLNLCTGSSGDRLQCSVSFLLGSTRG